MSSSKTPGFSQAELELAQLWSLSNVGQIKDKPVKAPKTPQPVVEEEELPPVLTVEEIEAMQKQAYDEAFEQGKKDGFQQGFEEGSKRGYEEKSHQLDQQSGQFMQLLESLSEPFKRLDMEVEQELVKLSIGIATQIIRREIKLDPGQVIATVREAINVLPLSSQKISLYLHPDDAGLVRSALSLDEMSTAWHVVEDPLITRGGCKVDTDVSRVDATIENRLAAVIANVLGGERQRDDKAAKAKGELSDDVEKVVEDEANDS